MRTLAKWEYGVVKREYGFGKCYIAWWTFVCLGMNGVAVARYGLILWENEAMGSRKVLKYLPGHRDTKNKSKNIAKVQNPNIQYVTVFLYKAARFMHREVNNIRGTCYNMLLQIPMCCNMLQYVTTCFNVLQHVAATGSEQPQELHWLNLYYLRVY